MVMVEFGQIPMWDIASVLNLKVDTVCLQRQSYVGIYRYGMQGKALLNIT